MRLLILTEGGRDVGFGHLTRCISLCQALKERNRTPQFIVNGDETIKDLLKNRNYEIFDWLKERSKALRMISGADAVVIDSYLADLSFYEAASKITKKAVYIDDNKRLDYPEGIVVNGSIYAEELSYPRKKNIGYMLGTKYMPLRREFWDASKKVIKKNIENVMITFGGDDMANMTSKILKFLGREYPKLVKNVVIGKGFKNIRQIENLKSKRTNLIYYPDAEKMERLMLKSDFAISAGGQTLYELARVGLPTIAVGIADNQLINVKGFARAGFLKYAGWHDDKNILERLSGLIKGLDDEKIRAKMSSLGRTLVDGKGSQRVIRRLLG